MLKVESSELATAINDKPKRKIAIIGTAPQWQLAPFDDPTWEIWGIYGVACAGKRLDRLYEIHKDYQVRPLIEKMYPDGKYWDVARSMGKNYISQVAFPETPEATPYDFEAKIKKYGPYFASSASWLIADAIDEGADEIGIWGVNMSSDGEYAHQKPSCCYLLGYAKAKGITITIPSSSELLSITHQYGYQDPPQFIQGMEQRKAEIQAELNSHKQNLKVSELGVYGCERMLSMVTYMEQNWKA